jgi:hypothetical protein
MSLNAATFAQGAARGRVWKTSNAAAADFLAQCRPVFVKLIFGVHDLGPREFGVGNRSRHTTFNAIGVPLGNRARRDDRSLMKNNGIVASRYQPCG